MFWTCCARSIEEHIEVDVNVTVDEEEEKEEKFLCFALLNNVPDSRNLMIGLIEKSKITNYVISTHIEATNMYPLMECHIAKLGHTTCTDDPELRVFGTDTKQRPMRYISNIRFEDPFIRDNYESALLFCVSNQLKEACMYLKSMGYNFNTLWPEGYPALHIAAANNDVDMIHLLISNKADVTIRDQLGQGILSKVDNCREALEYLVNVE